MAFLKVTPNFGKRFQSVETQNDIVDQLWGQLELLRHMSHPTGLNASKAMVPWLNQAEYYFLDAKKSRWRSAGLLYYYSFLNLAKAYLVGKRYFTVAQMKSTSIYHGLHSDPQSPVDITKFEVKIMPPTSSGKNNIFSAFYEKYTGTKWPFSAQIALPLSDIIHYSSSIGSELAALHKLNPAVALVQSLVRTDQNNSNTWFEMSVHASVAQTISKEFSNGQFVQVGGSGIGAFDRADWFAAYRVTNVDINNRVFFHSPKMPITPTTQDLVSNQMMKTVSRNLETFALPSTERRADDSWTFFPKVTIAGKRIHWRPLLTDYVFAFALSTILRYHPHLLRDGDKDSYLAKAWSSQSTVDALRYYVMLFTDPMIIVN